MTNLTGMTPDNFIKVEVSMYRVINNHDDCHPETCTCWDWRLVDGDNNCKKMSDDYKALQKLADTYNTQKQTIMKRPYLHNQKELKPFFIYAARCLFDIKSILGDKKTVNYTKLKSGLMLVWFKD